MASAAGAGAALWLHKNKTKENELCFRKDRKAAETKETARLHGEQPQACCDCTVAAVHLRICVCSV